ncbi:menaquinone biosynthesis protein [Helicobacter didelphidarum]|uniref:Chorismate dehydratase n=1 Tax=Helicobacter didelphidarum TaxID=2040648 RepID=A0A3D8IPD0_9HELI|nr:MqnA/MqnD/SBP family protein [Helicobacter didelphidarum]RDU67099.1 menaquinone biosynthesis protein [Helicobacter didelphidarum]
MRFGKIEYLNLLVFDIFVKQYPTSSYFKINFNLKKSYPAKLNRDFLFHRIDAGFISSIAGMKSYRRKKTCNAGIIANKEVWSVLVLPLDSKRDYQSATSNALSQVLNLKGEVLIGDRALQYYFQQTKKEIKTANNSQVEYKNKKNIMQYNQDSMQFLSLALNEYALQDFTDMAHVWYSKTKLPFVFGQMCFNQNGIFYNKMIESFCKKLGQGKNFKGIKVPHYILMQRIKSLNITKQFAQEYLKRIYYKIGSKEYIALLRFYRELRLKQIKPPKRF